MENVKVKFTNKKGKKVVKTFETKREAEKYIFLMTYRRYIKPFTLITISN